MLLLYSIIKSHKKTPLLNFFLFFKQWLCFDTFVWPSSLFKSDTEKNIGVDRVRNTRIGLNAETSSSSYSIMFSNMKQPGILSVKEKHQPSFNLFLTLFALHWLIPIWKRNWEVRGLLYSNVVSMAIYTHPNRSLWEI